MKNSSVHHDQPSSSSSGRNRAAVVVVITTINTYLPNEFRQNILTLRHGNHIEEENFNYMLERDILRNYLQEDLGVLRGDF